MRLLAFIMILAGLAALSLSMNRHGREMLRKEWTRAQRLVLRAFGGVLLAGSLLLLRVSMGWSLGALHWFGMIAVCGFCCACVLTYLPGLQLQKFISKFM